MFATLQEKSSNEKTTDQEESKKFSNRRFENNKIVNRSCVRMIILEQSKKRRTHFFEDVNSMY